MLEISTPASGRQFGDVERSVFARNDRLTYRWTPDFDEGILLSFRTESTRSADALLAIGPSDVSNYDVVFVDSFHTYQASRADLETAWEHLRPGGFMVVHDCNPPSALIASGFRQSDEWCGLTFAAFLDFVLAAHLLYLTLDTDYGVGVVYKSAEIATPSFVLDMMMLSGRSASAELWTSLDPATDRYPVFAAHRDELLRLTDPEIFLAALDDEPGHDGLSRYRRLERSRTATIGAMQREISAVAAAGDSARAEVRRLTEALADAERSSSLLRSEIESRAAVLHAVRGECEHLRADLDRATTALRVLEGTVFGQARAALLQSRTLTGIWSLYRRARPPRIGR
jgi:hypothetical protein